MTEKLTNLFVAGTFMSNQRNHYMMAGAQLMNAYAVTLTPNYIMRVFNSSSSPGQYTPGVMECFSAQQGAGYIEGELYEVDAFQLEKLDRFEQNGVRYQRVPILLQDDSLDEGLSAETYFFIADEEPAVGQDHNISVCEMNFSNAYRWNGLDHALRMG